MTKQDNVDKLQKMGAQCITNNDPSVFDVWSADSLSMAYRVSGTHDGDFMGVEPTGKPIEIRGLQMSRHADDGTILERWGSSDGLGILQQIGVVKVCTGPDQSPRANEETASAQRQEQRVWLSARFRGQPEAFDDRPVNSSHRCLRGGRETLGGLLSPMCRGEL